ncbi:MAG: alanine racemase [Acidobacteriota bacterium]|nr:alanine racemase [Acidobacteriota bacterium]
MDWQNLKTPCLILDAERVCRNAEQMSARMKAFGVNLRPHVKTHKCAEVAKIQTEGYAGGLTVSTLAEARAFAEHDFRDLLYAVPVEPGKFDEVCEIAKTCERFAVITDDTEIPVLLDETARRNDVKLDVFLKVDCGYHRCGVAPDAPEVLEIPRQIADAKNLRFAGILTHAGHAYHAQTENERLEIARAERDSMTNLARKLNENSVEVPAVSIGSTPTITCVDHLDGITEARPGNYIFFDAFQAALGSCRLEDCALTVLTAVVHRSSRERKIIVDAGAIALSKDAGAIEFDSSAGFGRVSDSRGDDLNLRVDLLSQEHGTIFVEDEKLFEKLKVGERVRILANHSCLTAAQYSFYNVLEGERIVDRWERFNGW